MKVFSVSFGSGSGGGGGSKNRINDDRPFSNVNSYHHHHHYQPQNNMKNNANNNHKHNLLVAPGSCSSGSGSENHGTYIISSPPRFDDTLNSERMSKPAHRNSVPDLLNNSGFTIYDDQQTQPFYPPPQQQQKRPPPPPYGSAVLQSQQRKRHGGNFSNPGSPKLTLRNPFQRSRSSSGRRRHHQQPQPSETGFVWPTMTAGSNTPVQQPKEEPIYSEPLPPVTPQIREAERTMLRFYPDPNDPVQISNHIYEYLVSRRTDASTQSCTAQKQNGAKNNKANAGQKSSALLHHDVVVVDADEMRRRRRRGSLASSSSPSSASGSTSKKSSEDKTSIDSSGIAHTQ